MGSILNYTNNQRVIKIEYRSPMVDNEEKIKFNKFELNTYAYVSVMWSIFHHYANKSLIKVDVALVRSTVNNLKMVKHFESFVGDEMSC